MYIIGIDPGQNGAIALIKTDCFSFEILGIFDLEYEDNVISNLNDVFSHILARAKKKSVICFLEQVHSRPTDGKASAFKFGKIYGMLLGFLIARRLPYTLIHPRKWRNIIKKHFLGARNISVQTADKKEWSLQAARALSNDQEYFKRKKDHNRAEAFLIALAGAHEICHTK